MNQPLHRRLPLLPLLLLALVAGGCEPPAATSADLDELMEEEQESRPDAGTTDAGYPEVSSDLAAERADHARGFLDRLDEIDPAGLDDEDRTRFARFQETLEGRILGYEAGTHFTPIDHEGGPHSSFMRLTSRTSFDDVEDYEEYLVRLRTAPDYLRQYAELMREGMETGYTRPAAVLGGHQGMIDSYLEVPPEESPLYAPFHEFPSAVPDQERTRLREEGVAAIEEGAYPALREFQVFLVEEYIPAARDSYAISDVPGGRAYYEHMVRSHTTLDITAQEVHDIGLSEVARIRAEMLEIIDDLEFQGDFDDFVEFLRTDPQFYVDTPEELIQIASTIAKQVDGLLPQYFHLKTLPKQPYGVEPVPADLAPNYTGGRYSGSSRDDRAGFYWVNTYNLPSRTLYTLPALTLHEAVPGHHLQIATNREMDVGSGGITAFSEGWALYAEHLGAEMGIYDDPYSDFGRLTYEMWRACRLVVDTGVHALGWSRDEVLDFLASNTALSLHEVRTETDRYIAVPGQALSYKMGELTIRRLRAEAEEALGDDFDLRDYHHVVLENGPVPLTVLEENVRSWIMDQRSDSTE
ncbi:MAG: DUF885 domain-containing protein [Gemmatimonadota bacterium]